MAKCNFKIDFTESIDTLIEKAKNGITSIGGTFKGDTERGTFLIPTRLGQIVGNYLVKNNSIDFEITEKPKLVSCNKIEAELRKYLDSAAQELMNFD